jgi:multidrug resistance protein
MSWRSSRAVAVALVTFATFIDLIAYSVCVPVLPDFARRLGASPTMIGLLFASFGLTLVAVSVPMGAVSDRVGRRLPLVAGMLALSASTALFAVARSLPLLFVARLIQGAADGVTWVVGFALLADLYGPAERGRVMGYVMSGTSVGILIGPSIGGWLYEMGGVELPFAFVAGLALVSAVLFAFSHPAPAHPAPSHAAPSHPAPSHLRTPAPSIWSLLQVPVVAVCTAFVVIIGATLAMLEPVLPLFFNRRLGLSPSEIGLLFGAAAVVSIVMPMVYGPLASRWGGRPLIILGLILTAAWLPMLPTATSLTSALVLIVVQWMAIALVITPSLAYMAEVTAATGAEAYGLGYGLYNTAWAIGLLGGPALGGFLFDHAGFRLLTLLWAPTVVIVTVLLARITRAGKLELLPH